MPTFTADGSSPPHALAGMIGGGNQQAAGRVTFPGNPNDYTTTDEAGISGYFHQHTAVLPPSDAAGWRTPATERERKRPVVMLYDGQNGRSGNTFSPRLLPKTAITEADIAAINKKIAAEGDTVEARRFFLGELLVERSPVIGDDNDETARLEATYGAKAPAPSKERTQRPMKSVKKSAVKQERTHTKPVKTPQLDLASLFGDDEEDAASDGPAAVPANQDSVMLQPAGGASVELPVTWVAVVTEPEFMVVAFETTAEVLDSYSDLFTTPDLLFLHKGDDRLCKLADVRAYARDDVIHFSYAIKRIKQLGG